MNHFIHVAADAVHLLAAGAWLGGLVSLLAILTRKVPSPHQSEIDITAVLMRFSGMGYLAVAGLIITGLLNSWYIVGSLSSIPSTLYGQLLVVKLGFFALMLLLAAMNRFWLVPAFESTRQGPESEAKLARLRSHVIAEEALGALIVVVVSALGTLSPVEGT